MRGDAGPVTIYPEPPLLYPEYGHRYVLADAYTARLDVGPSTYDIDVPAGFASDGASIPRWLWPLVGHPFAPIRARASLLHDWLYESKIVSRAEADDIYRTVLIETGMLAPFAWLEWIVLRCAGWLHW